MSIKIISLLLLSTAIIGAATHVTYADSLELQNSILQQTGNNIAHAFATNTGNDTSVDNKTSTTNTSSVQNTNTSNVTQQANLQANTGNNEASRNISIGGNAGMITTGNASASVLAFVSANNTQNNLQPTIADVHSQSTTNTGNGSTVSTQNSSDSRVNLVNGNTATIHQGANTNVNTGNNVADRNISIGGSAGQILTGNASSDTSFVVSANGTAALVGGNSSGNGPGSGASIILANTGNRGHFNTSSQTNTATTVTNANTASVNQSCGAICLAITGGNSSDRGIARGGDAGVITTSDAIIRPVFIASVNGQNTRASSATPESTQQLSGVNTGDNTDVSTHSQHTTSTQASNSNNSDVSQFIQAVADTGNNHANRNIAIGGNAGIIHTGSAVIDAYMSAVLNTTATQLY